MQVFSVNQNGGQRVICNLCDAGKPHVIWYDGEEKVGAAIHKMLEHLRKAHQFKTETVPHNAKKNSKHVSISYNYEIEDRQV